MSWHCEQEDGINPHSYFLRFPTRVQLGSDPRDLRAIDIFLYPDHLIAVDAWEAEKFRIRIDQASGGQTFPSPSPILHFTREEYPTHFERLFALAEDQRAQKNDERHVALLGAFLKGQD